VSLITKIKLGLSAGASTNKLLSNVELRKIMLYLLTNLEEVDPYIA
jgi:hypothetical protein